MTANEDTPRWPALSFVMPVLNERQHVRRALDSVLAQDYPAPFDVVVVLGPSTDGTDAIVEAAAAADDRIRIVRVDVASIPHSLNSGFAACTATVVARVDAHAALPQGYVRRAVETLLERDAANVGGIMDADGDEPFQRAVADAYNSRFGLGGGPYHLADAPAGPAESVYLGVMRRDAVTTVGGYDETVGRGEDWELNRRLRDAGYLVWLDPALRVTYFPRSSGTALVRQFWATGAWRGDLVRRFGLANSWRYFVPPALVASSGLGVGATVASRFARGSRWAHAVRTAGALGSLAHLALVGGVAIRSKGSVAQRARFGFVLVLMHYAWGAGFVKGLLRGAARVEDRSRVTRQQRDGADALRAQLPLR